MKDKVNDVLGISCASFCLIHCLLVPLFTILPLGVFDNIWIDLFFCAAGLVATINVIKSQSTLIVKLILGISISIVVISVMIEYLFNTHFEGMLVGGFGLIIGHGLNYKNHKH
jgi:hypothetical protein